MTLIRTFMLALLLLAGVVVTFAQSEQASKSIAPSDATVTISISAKGVRFTALGSIGQMRLEVFNPSGETLYNSDFKAGNVQDWALEDKLGQPLVDDSYLCVVTVRDLSGRLGMKQGSVLVQAGQASLKLGESGQVGAVEPEKVLAPVADGNATALTLLAHDGQQGRIVSGRGGLSFGTGDFFAGKEVEHMRLTAKGNPGLGVVDPQAKLDVAGLIRTSEGTVFPDGSVQTTAYVASGRSLSARAPRTQRDAQGHSITEQGSKPVGTEKGLRLTPNAPTSMVNSLAKFSNTSGALTDSNVFEINGNVSFGATSPSASVHTSRGDGSYQYKMERTGTNAHVYGFGADSNGLFFLDDVTNLARRVTMDAGGNIGFGTTNPSASVHTSRGDGSYQYKMERTGTNAHVYGFGADSNGLFFLDDVTSLARRMTMDTNGNVGIGTSGPQAKLHVAGDIQVVGNAVIAGNIAAKYQDVAEWVPARQPLVAGTVVSLDTTRANAVAASARAYDPHVAGVVSAQPGVILGEGGAGKVLVATTGRVKVKVDATRHPIKIGDLLVTSNTPGAAKKSQPIKVGGALMHRPGTIIGKALEPLAKGQGEILMLLSLQ